MRNAQHSRRSLTFSINEKRHNVPWQVKTAFCPTNSTDNSTLDQSELFHALIRTCVHTRTENMPMPVRAKSDFFEAIEMELRSCLPENLRHFQVRQFRGNFQVFFENSRIHYEVWVDTRRNHLELGLHLESDPVTTAHLLRCLDKQIVAIKHELGTEAELERWTNTWGRLVEFQPISPRTHERGREIGKRLSIYISTLEPVLSKCTQPG
jgi:hypothetical protein